MVETETLKKTIDNRCEAEFYTIYIILNVASSGE